MDSPELSTLQSPIKLILLINQEASHRKLSSRIHQRGDKYSIQSIWYYLKYSFIDSLQDIQPEICHNTLLSCGEALRESAS